MATVSKRWLSMRATYAVQIAPGQNDVLILALRSSPELVYQRALRQFSVKRSPRGSPPLASCTDLEPLWLEA